MYNTVHLSHARQYPITSTQTLVTVVPMHGSLGGTPRPNHDPHFLQKATINQLTLLRPKLRKIVRTAVD